MKNTTSKNDIKIFHIGGRNGTIEFPKLPKFKNNLKIYLFEADEDCIEDIKKNNKDAEVFPYCILDKNKNVYFNIMHDPHASSIYEINDKFNEYFSEGYNFYYTFKNAFKIKKRIKIKSYSLDFLNNKKLIPKPDFLSIDAQGSEYLILKGSSELIKKNLVGISVEANFVPLYKNQYTFEYINELLIKDDFILADIDLRYYNFNKLSYTLRGKYLPYGCDAIFLKDPKKIYNSDIKAKDKATILKKLSFISFAYGFNEIGFKCLEYLVTLNLKNENKNKIDDFLIKCNEFRKKNIDTKKDWIDNDLIDKKIKENQQNIEKKFENTLIRKILNFKNNPINYSKTVLLHYYKNYISSYLINIIIPFKIVLSIKNKTKFQIFLEKNGFFLASKRISNR